MKWISIMLCRFFFFPDYCIYDVMIRVELSVVFVFIMSWGEIRNIFFFSDYCIYYVMIRVELLVVFVFINVLG